MDKLFRWLVILVLSLLTAYVVIAEYIEVPELQTPVEVIIIKKKEVVVEKPVVKKQATITKNNTQSWQKEADAQPDFSTYEVQELIRKYAWIYGVDVGLALRIAGCESGRFRPARAKKYWWEWYSRFHAEANVAVSIQMLANESTSHWNESKKCRWK